MLVGDLGTVRMKTRLERSVKRASKGRKTFDYMSIPSSFFCVCSNEISYKMKFGKTDFSFSANPMLCELCFFYNLPYTKD